MKSFVKLHSVYFSLYGIFTIAAGIILFLQTKESIHLYLNKSHNPTADVFFTYATDLGDGIALILLAVILLFISKRMAFQVALSGIISGLIAQFLKLVVFGATLRPSAHFKDLGIDLYYVPGVEMNTIFSFPSGHSTAIFAMITSLVLIQKTRKFDFLFFVLAFLVAYSRVYLSQHFLSDILLGSFIGLFTAIFVYLWLHSSKMLGKKNLDNSLINFSTKRT